MQILNFVILYFFHFFIFCVGWQPNLDGKRGPSFRFGLLTPGGPNDLAILVAKLGLVPSQPTILHACRTLEQGSELIHPLLFTEW